MQVIFHIGAHCTDDGQIQACLAQNKHVLATEGIIIPNPGRFRPILRETIAALRGGPANAEVQQLMLESIVKDVQPERIIFSNDAFICNVQRVLADDMLYPDAGDRSRKLRNLFPDQQVEFCLAIRNPATFLPACFTKMNTGEFDAYIAQIKPLSIRWSEVISRIQTSNPGIPLKVWSNEDTPFIWPELISEITDHDPATKMKGIDDYVASIMTAEGVERMKGYLQTHPPANESQRRRILSAFLDKFEAEDDVGATVSAPEWTDDLVDELTDKYEEDLYTIERLPGVQFITP